MATTVIQNSCVAGVMAGLMGGRWVGSVTATDYATIANIARAIADELIVENTASTSPMDDADNAQIGPLVESVAMATIIGQGPTTSGTGGAATPADYINFAKQIYAASKQALTKLVAVLPPPAPVVPLLTAGNYAILAKSGITNTGTSAITGNMGVSPIAASAITGFALSYTPGAASSTSAQVTGLVYASDYAPPTPANLTQAVNDMQAAYTNAAGRAPDFTEFHGGLLGGETLIPGVYKWSTGVSISSDITLSGDASSVYIFEIAGVLSLASAMSINLGSVLPANVFWQVAGNVAIGANANFNGVILCFTDIALGAGATLAGQCLAQTAVTLNTNTVN